MDSVKSTGQKATYDSIQSSDNVLRIVTEQDKLVCSNGPYQIQIPLGFSDKRYLSFQFGYISTWQRLMARLAGWKITKIPE